MANKKNIDYETILNAYSLGNEKLSKYEDSQKKERQLKGKRFYGIKTSVKRNIRRIFHNIYDENQLWDELSKQQQDSFVYISMKGYMFKVVDKVYGINPKKIKEIKKKINEKNTLNLKAFEKQNQLKIISDKYYYHKEAYEAIENQVEQLQAKKEDYKKFEEAFKQVLPHLNPPTFEEWDKENQQIPRRLKDYELEAVLNNTSNEPYDSDEYIDTTMSIAEFNNRVKAETDHVVLQCIVKILEELGIAEIDINKIEENSRTLISYEDMPTPPILEDGKLLAMSREERLQEIDKMYGIDKDGTLENLTYEKRQEYIAMRAKYDSTLVLSEEMQDEYNKEANAFFQAQKKREQLDFYKFLGEYQNQADKVKQLKQDIEKYGY